MRLSREERETAVRTLIEEALGAIEVMEALAWPGLEREASVEWLRTEAADLAIDVEFGEATPAQAAAAMAVLGARLRKTG